MKADPRVECSGVSSFRLHPSALIFSGMVQLVARRALNSKMKVRLLLPQPKHLLGSLGLSVFAVMNLVLENLTTECTEGH